MTHMVSLLLSSSDFHYTMHIYISDICTHHLISVADALRDSSYVPTDSYLKRPYARLMLFCAQYYHIVGILRKKSEGFMTHMVSSYDEHWRQTLTFHRYVIYEERNLGNFLSSFDRKNQRVLINRRKSSIFAPQNIGNPEKYKMQCQQKR